MIRLSDCSLRNTAHADGEISRSVTELRPVEKPFEESLIATGNAEGRVRPRILKANELCLVALYFKNLTDTMQLSVDTMNEQMMREGLMAGADVERI